MRNFTSSALAFFLAFPIALAAGSEDCSKCHCTKWPVPDECEKCCHMRLFDAASEVINQIMASPDTQIPDSILRQATCVGVVPGMLKGAFILGVEYSQGAVTCRTGHGWSAPAFIQMEGGSWGFQIGGEGTDLVLVAVNDKGFQDLSESRFKIGADASAAAGPVGRDAHAATNWKLQSGLLTWSRSEGLLAGVDLSGVAISQNHDADEALYGSSLPVETILHGDVPVPRVAQPFVQTVAKYFRSSSRTY